jgi:hypothetical protein
MIRIAKSEYPGALFFIPASVVQLHPDCEVLLDAAAASRIKDKIRLD